MLRAPRHPQELCSKPATHLFALHHADATLPTASTHRHCILTWQPTFLPCITRMRSATLDAMWHTPKQCSKRLWDAPLYTCTRVQACVRLLCAAHVHSLACVFFGARVSARHQKGCRVCALVVKASPSWCSRLVGNCSNVCSVGAAHRTHIVGEAQLVQPTQPLEGRRVDELQTRRVCARMGCRGRRLVGLCLSSAGACCVCEHELHERSLSPS